MNVEIYCYINKSLFFSSTLKQTKIPNEYGIDLEYNELSQNLILGLMLLSITVI